MMDGTDLSFVVIFLTIAVCLFAEPISSFLNVIDHPDDDRKDHARPTPLVGGVAIILPLAVWAAVELVFGSGVSHDLNLVILCCSCGVAIVGFLDDQHTISATGRLFLLIIFAAVALKLDPALITNRLHTTAFGWTPVSPEFIAPLMVFALVGFSSAVNMADGTNGLVVALLFLWSACLWILSDASTAHTAQIIAGGSLVTLLFNAQGRLFLGDCGTFALAFTVGVLAILTHNAGHLPLESVIVWFFIPVADCLRLIPLRLYHGRSPFRPDKHHFHHRLAARLGEGRALLAYVGAVGVTSFAATFEPALSTVCLVFLGTFYVMFLFADAFIQTPALAQNEPAQDTDNIVRLGKGFGGKKDGLTG
ncbi:MAG TPA: MraY family glycosyltransferase [Rhizomicrobium sp.]|jgi:UDP-GlcNAc:undecaprenyl-phosphate GlcNAc-1-phosphate transferase|nr:MraY family glycosyltransferase [Rhizomicrobium sp.]